MKVKMCILLSSFSFGAIISDWLAMILDAQHQFYGFFLWFKILKL